MNRHMDFALGMARYSTSRFRLGAVVIRKNRVIGRGFNVMGKTHPTMQKYVPGEWTPGIHAEVKASLRVAAKQLTGATIYIARVLRDGRPAMARPCFLCEQFLREAGIKTVYYSTANGMERMAL